MMPVLTPLHWRAAALFVVAIAAAGALVLWSMGRPLICACGHVSLWHGSVDSAENSQHLLDWYSLTHVTHGFLLYAGLWLACRIGGWTFKPAAMLICAVALETTWEIVENTDFVIDRYRTATLALNYRGDSVVNSMGDIASMMAGFLAASSLPLAASVILVLASEAALAMMIRDNLFLNILMLLFPVEAIRDWQKV